MSESSGHFGKSSGQGMWLIGVRLLHDVKCSKSIGTGLSTLL